MAQHLSEKLALEKVSRGVIKKKLANECADLILKLWVYRHSIPDGSRPFESFEPILQTLHELDSKGPRSSYLRAVPSKIKAPKEVEVAISMALTIDRAARTLIRFLLAEAVAAIPKKDKRWAKLRAAVSQSDWDVRVVIQLIGAYEALVGEKQKLKVEAIRELEEMIGGLQVFRKTARQVTAQLSNRLAAASAT